jgi:hypothetical protein
LTASRLGFALHHIFVITLHKKDIELLKKIQNTLNGVGRIYIRQNKVDLRVRSLKEICNVIIPHFDKYPLITKKQVNYILFREIVMRMKAKEHLSKEGLQAIVNIRASLNFGLSEDLKGVFPEVKPVQCPNVEFKQIPDPE